MSELEILRICLGLAFMQEDDRISTNMGRLQLFEINVLPSVIVLKTLNIITPIGLPGITGNTNVSGLISSWRGLNTY
jgi:hypothetical protein